MPIFHTADLPWQGIHSLVAAATTLLDAVTLGTIPQDLQHPR